MDAVDEPFAVPDLGVTVLNLLHLAATRRRHPGPLLVMVGRWTWLGLAWIAPMLGGACLSIAGVLTPAGRLVRKIVVNVLLVVHQIASMRWRQTRTPAPRPADKVRPAATG
jgi:hypothetical protein